jgi:hypothetical protein
MSINFCERPGLAGSGRWLGVPRLPLLSVSKPGIERAQHLASIPILRVSSAALATHWRAWTCSSLSLPLSDRATLRIIDHADHSFKVSAKSGRAASDAEAETLDGLTG